MITGRIVSPTFSQRLHTQNILPEIIQRTTRPAGQGFEIRDGQHHGAVFASHSSHFGNRALRRIEMVHRPLADTRIKAPFLERKVVSPASHPQRMRLLSLGHKELSHPRHSTRRLGSDHGGPPSRQSQGILTHPARYIENS